MAKDKDKSTKPLFDDPFAELVDADMVSDAAVKPEADSQKRSSAKTTKKTTTAKTKREEKPKTTAQPKPASSKRTKKTTAKTKREEMPKAAAKVKTPSPKRTKKKTTVKTKREEKPKAAAKVKTPSPKRAKKKTTVKTKRQETPKTAAKVKTPSRKRTTKTTTAKIKREEMPAAAAKPKTASRKRTVKKTAAKSKPEEKAAATAKPEAGVEESITTDAKRNVLAMSGIDETTEASQIADQLQPDDRMAIGSSQEIILDSTKGRTLLETLIASIDEGDEKAMERAAMAALPFIRQIEAIEGEQHVIFSLAEREYAVSIDNVVEIGEPLNTTPVPNVPGWVLGVANLRGDIVSVVDLRAFMGLPPAAPGQEKRMLVAQSSDAEVSTCVVVDQVRGIRYLNVDQLAEQTSAATDFIAQFIRGICEDDGLELAVLDFERVLSSERMQAI